MSIYIHIPFCTTICTYCDFCKIYYSKKYINIYLENLKKEIRARYRGEKVNTIYIGGGTPTSLDDEELTNLLEITKIFNTTGNCEFTVESNIESITESKLKIMQKYHVNRISIGVQSFNKDIIKLLGRKHTKEEVYDKIKLVKKYFNNINVDLIYAAYDDINILKDDISNLLALEVPHISAYSLIVEDNTILKVNGFKSISEDTDYEMYKYIENTLEKHNYIHYEISNYAKEGYKARHNLVYWHNDYYYGFGLSSTSFLNNTRMVNTMNLNSYLKGEYLKEENKESARLRMENEVMLSLRLLEGLNLTSFKKKYHVPFHKVFNVSSLIDDGYLVIEGSYLKINKDYIYTSNEIIIRIFELTENVK